MEKSAGSQCLDEEDVLAFATGELEAAAPDRHGQALVHVDECESCRSLIAEVARENTSLSEAEDRGSDTNEPLRDDREHRESNLGELIDNRFRLVAALGSGAMGTVYRAHDEKLGSDVALKLLRKDENARDTDKSARAFAQELKVGRRVTHPNVCRVYDAGRHEGASYITMELVEGETLAELLARDEPPLLKERALDILRGVTEGLAAAHAQGIVHRDLKPANVMLENGTNRPVLTDFGLAADTLQSNQSRRLVGTPSFWAPEQARGERATPASDVYSLGLLAYRLLVGREFSLSDSDSDALMTVPRAYRSFVAACLASRPKDRPQSAAEALVLLSGSRKRRWVVVPSALAVTALLVWLILAQRATPAPTPPTTTPTMTIANAHSSVVVPAAVANPELGAPRTAPDRTAPESPASSSSLAEKKISPLIPKENATRATTVHPAVGGGTVTPGTVTPSVRPPVAAASSGAPPPPPKPSADPLYRH